MQSIREEIRSLAEDVRGYFDVADGEDIQRAQEILYDVSADIDRLTSEDAYHEHLVGYLKREKRAFEEGDRDRLLCSCGDPYCPLKRGTLPPRVLMSDDIDKGVTTFKTSHHGEPTVLLDAREEWYDLSRDVRHALRRASMAIQGHDPDAVERDEQEATA